MWWRRAAKKVGEPKGAAAKVESQQRTYYRELNKVVESADVIIQVLDARDPEGCRSKMVENRVTASGHEKRLILVLNKVDLVPPDVVEKWLFHLRKEFPAIAFKASTQESAGKGTKIGHAKQKTSKASQSVMQSTACVGGSTLLQLLKNYSRNKKMKTAVTVGVIGYPNVGKSSLINSMKRARAVGVSAVPGFTKVMQEVQLDSKIKLLDCPGVIFEEDSHDPGLLLRNCISVDQLEDPIPAAHAVFGRCRPAQLMHVYNLPRFGDREELLLLLAQQRGYVGKGGVADKLRAARMLLKDWNTGKIPFYTLPPETAAEDEARCKLKRRIGRRVRLEG